LFAIEEGVGSTRVDHDLVLDTGILHGLTELLDHLDRDAGVLTGHQAQHRALELINPVDGAQRWPLRIAVEANRPGQAVAGGGLMPGVAAAEAEPHSEHRSVRVALAEVSDSRSSVGGHPLDGGQGNVLGVGEGFASLAHPGSAPEVVDGDRVVAVLGETKRQMLIEMVETAYVGEDDHPGSFASGTGGGESGKLVAVGCGQREILTTGYSTIDRLDWGTGVGVVTHG